MVGTVRRPDGLLAVKPSSSTTTFQFRPVHSLIEPDATRLRRRVDGAI
jgi:hypothetical protein